MADMTTIKGRIAETIYPNGKGAITAEKHQALLLEMVDDINAKKADKEEVTAVAESVSTLSQEVESNRVNLTESINALEQKVDNLPQGDVFDKEGNYPLLHVGTADTAIDLAGRGESVPASFGFRASGGKSIKDGRAYIKRIKGNSVVWNQLYDRPNQTVTNNGMTSIKNEDGSLSISGTLSQTYATLGAFTDNIENHTYLFMLVGSKTLDGKRFALLNRNADAAISSGFAYFFHKNTNISLQRQIGFSGFQVDEVVNDTFFVLQIDLTKMFGAGNEPTTIEEFYARKPIVEDEYAYNEGEVIHMTAEGIKSVGDNAFNGVWYQGGVVENSGQPLAGSLTNIYTDTFSVIGGETYCSQFDGANLYLKGYFFDKSGAFIGSSDFDVTHGTKKWVVPINADSVRMRVYNVVGNIAPSQAPNVMITLVHSGWKQDTDAGYQPYWQDTLSLPIIRKYFPQGMKSAGSAHDEIRYNKVSGKWEYSKGKIKSVDLGDLEWIVTTINNAEYFMSSLNKLGAKVFPMNQVQNYLSSHYEATSVLAYNKNADKTIALNNGYYNSNDRIDYIAVRDTAYTDAATFKAAMAGVMLYYEAADWEWVELDAEDQNFRDYYNVADFGTEQSQSEVPSANFSADIIYQFNAVDMIREHEIEITELQSIIATMQAQLTALTNGGQ